MSTGSASLKRRLVLWLLGPMIVLSLLDEEADSVQWLAAEVGRQVRFQVEPSYGREQFDVVLVQGVQHP